MEGSLEEPIITEYVPLTVNGETYVYLMSNDWVLLIDKLVMFGCNIPKKEDFFLDNQLPKNVRAKMVRLCKKHGLTAIGSLTISVGMEFSELSLYEVEIDEVVTLLIKDLLPHGEMTTVEKVFSYIADNKSTEIEELVKNGYDLEQVIQQGATALHGAAILNSFNSAAALLRLGANINAQNVDGETPLMSAIVRNSIETAALLISNKNIDLEVIDNNGNTALIRAAIHKNVPITKMLIEAGANLNAQNNIGKTALHVSIEMEQNEIAELLIDSGADVNYSDSVYQTPIILTAINDNVIIAKKLIAAGANLDINNILENIELLAAVLHNSVNFLKYYLKNQNVSTFQFVYAFNKAIEYNCRKSIVTMLENNNDPSDCATTLLHSVCKEHKPELMDLCLKFKCNVNEIFGYGTTPLMIACCAFSGTDTIVTQLIENGADIDLADEYGMTALMYAASKSNINLMKILLDNGADRTIQDNEGKTYKDYLKTIDLRTFSDFEADRFNEKWAALQALHNKEEEEEIPEEYQTFNERFYFYRNRFFRKYPEFKNNDSAIYKPVGISKQTYSKLKSNSTSRHDKKTVLKLTFGLRLTVKESEALLQSAGYTLSKTDKTDVEIRSLLIQRRFKPSDWTENVADSLGIDS